MHPLMIKDAVGGTDEMDGSLDDETESHERLLDPQMVWVT